MPTGLSKFDGIQSNTTEIILSDFILQWLLWHKSRDGTVGFPAGHLTTSAPSAPGHHGEGSKHPLSAHHCPSCSGWCLTHSSPRAAAWTLEFRSNGSLWQSREPFLWGQDHGSFCVVFCCSPPLMFFFQEMKTHQSCSASPFKTSLFH